MIFLPLCLELCDFRIMGFARLSSSSPLIFVFSYMTLPTLLLIGSGRMSFYHLLGIKFQVAILASAS